MNERSKLTGGWILLISLSFSCGTPGPAEEIGPEIRVSEGRVLEVSKGQPFEAGPLIALGGGELVLGMSGSSLVSLDRGETWSIRPPFPKSHVLVRRDGPAYVLKGRTEPASDTPGLFAADYLEADDAGAIPTNPTTWKQATVTLPQWTSLTGDDGTHVTTLHITGPLLELRDGTLLAGSYGNFQGDTASIEGFVPTEGEKWFKYRTYLLRSADSGRNWNYYSTVAYDGVTGQESFCEPAVVDFGDGKMLAVMRTGRFAPMYQARSLDGGLSWGNQNPPRFSAWPPRW